MTNLKRRYFNFNSGRQPAKGVARAGFLTRAIGNGIDAWDDLRTPTNTAKKITGKEPADTAYKGGIVQAFSDSADNGVGFTVQLPHKYHEGEDIEFHVHIIIPVKGSGAGAENVKFDLTHSWANQDGVFPAETPVSETIDVQAEGADIHLYRLIAVLDGTGKEISSVVICSLTRDTGVANNYANPVYLSELDFHFPLDAVGSTTQTVK